MYEQRKVFAMALSNFGFLPVLTAAASSLFQFLHIKRHRVFTIRASIVSRLFVRACSPFQTITENLTRVLWHGIVNIFDFQIVILAIFQQIEDPPLAHRG